MCLCKSGCEDRQEQEGKCLQAHSLVKLKTGWGPAEVSALAGFEAAPKGRTAAGRGDVRCLGGLAEVGEDARDQIRCRNEGDPSNRPYAVPTAIGFWPARLIPQFLETFDGDGRRTFGGSSRSE